MGRGIRILFIPFMLVAAGWCSWWIYALEMAKAETQRLERKFAARELELRCGDPRWSGFPFQIKLSCRPFAVISNAEGDGRMLTIPRVRFLAQAFDPRHVLALTDGEARWTSSDGKPLATAGRLAASFRRGSVEELSLLGEEIDLASGFSTSRVNLRLTHDRTSDTNEIGFAVESRDTAARVPYLSDEPFDFLSASGSLRTADASTLVSPETLHAIELKNTALSLEQFELRQKRLAISAQGEIGLDETARLDGKLRLAIANMEGILDRFVSAGLLSASEAQGSALLLALVGGNGGRIKLDLVADHGEIHLGPFRLGRLKPLLAE